MITITVSAREIVIVDVKRRLKVNMKSKPPPYFEIYLDLRSFDSSMEIAVVDESYEINQKNFCQL